MQGPKSAQDYGVSAGEERRCANLVCWLCLQLFKQLLRLLLRREPAHRGDRVAGLGWAGLGFCADRIWASACSGRWLIGPRSSLYVCDPGSGKGDGGRVENEKGFLVISGVGPDFASGIDEWMLSKHFQGGRVAAALVTKPRPHHVNPIWTGAASRPPALGGFRQLHKVPIEAGAFIEVEGSVTSPQASNPNPSPTRNFGSSDLTHLSSWARLMGATTPG